MQYKTHDTRVAGQKYVKNQLKSRNLSRKCYTVISTNFFSKNPIFCSRKYAKNSWRPRNRSRKSHSARHSLLSSIWLDGFKNTLIISWKWNFWAKRSCGINEAKSPKFLEFLAYASCLPYRQRDPDCVGSYFTQPNTFSWLSDDLSCKRVGFL